MRIGQATQINQAITVATPLGDDILLFRSMNVSEALGRLFQCDLELLSGDPNVNLDKILGQNVTVRFKRADGETRYFNGFVSRFSQAGELGEFVRYEATLQPWFWLLTRTADCRIFQETTVPEIIIEIFREHNFTDFKDALTETYRTWEYCVQYRETDFNFISRLMEQEGIYYYFTHEDGKHTLVLSDSLSGHNPVAGYEEVPYYPPQQSMRRKRDHIYGWNLTREVQPGAFAMRSFDFHKPRAKLLAEYSIPRDHAQAEYEIYDYPGEYAERTDGDVYVRTRIEELQAQYEQVNGQGNASGLTAGCLFKLTRYPRSDQNKEYLITAMRFEIGPLEYESTSERNEGPRFSCRFTAINSFETFRPPRTTPKPVVQGLQTAVVAGRTGEEIWTDEYGRVKVQFHWDRYGKSDENSSCWMRVSQVHAGRGFGGVDIPRIGEEVIVSFLEGDPDSPIIIGRVYNNDNRPPTGLPAAGMVSGLKSNSTPGGGGYNEISMNDTKGQEAVTVHAQKDMTTTVENDCTTTVVGGNNVLAVQAGTRSVTVQGDTSLTVQAGDRTVHVTGNYKLDTTNEVSIQAPTKISLTCGGSSITLEPGSITISAGGGSSLVLDANAFMHSSGNSEVRLDGNANVKSSGGSQVLLDSNALMNSNAGDQVLLDGNATISSPGEATVEAPTCTLAGGGSTTKADASGVAVTGPKVSLNG